MHPKDLRTVAYEAPLCPSLIIRDNDGSNQCLPPSAWMTLADRLANRAIDAVIDPIAKQHLNLAN